VSNGDGGWYDVPVVKESLGVQAVDDTTAHGLFRAMYEFVVARAMRHHDERCMYLM
jgi:hypothetical protein